MAELQRLTRDPTITNLVNQHDQEIGNIVDEANRQADLLDSLNTSLKIIARGTLTMTFDGSSQYPVATATLGSGTSNTFVAYMQRSDDLTKVYSLPYYLMHGTGLAGAISTDMYVRGWVSANTISFFGETNGSYSAPTTLTIFYYIIQQPASVTT